MKLSLKARIVNAFPDMTQEQIAAAISDERCHVSRVELNYVISGKFRSSPKNNIILNRLSKLLAEKESEHE